MYTHPTAIVRFGIAFYCYQKLHILAIAHSILLSCAEFMINPDGDVTESPCLWLADTFPPHITLPATSHV